MSLQQEFTAALDAKGYSYTVDNGRVTVDHDGSVFLRSLTTIPKNTVFKNDATVYLNSLTTLPEGTMFKNRGSVYLNSLTSPYQSYRGKHIRLEHIDHYTMLICSERKIGEMTLYRARYFGGGDLDQLKPCYVAHEGEHYAHGDSVKQAIRDLRFKVLQADTDCDELVAEIKARGTVTFNDYRLLTGACESGLEHGLAQLGREGVEEMPLADALELCRGQYGGETFIRFFVEASA